MTKSNLFRQAHRLTRMDRVKYRDIDYRVQFGLNLKMLMGKLPQDTLPQLTGTEKQVKWAEEIRIKRIQNLNNAKAKESKENQVTVQEVIDFMKAKTEATFYIETRQQTLVEFFKGLMAAM